MRDAHRLTVTVVTAALLCLGACASAEGDGSGKSNADARLDGDGAPIPTPPDADLTRPDADPNAPDAGPDANTASCVTTPCDLVPQCGCTDTEACDLDSANFATGGTECRNVSTSGTETSTCNGSDEDCGAGFVCLGANPNYHCRKWCASDTDCVGDGAHCVVRVTYGGGMDVPGATACSKSCDPLSTSNPTGCPSPGYGCYVSVRDPGGANEQVYTDCAFAGAGTDGITCANRGDCAAGFDCITTDGGTSYACRQSCLRPNGACTVGSCRALSPAPVVGANEYGTCVPLP